jgi:hypothetical protein
MVVNQIAAAALVKSEDGLRNAMDAVSGGSLPGCSVAVSGKYRTLDHFGRLITRAVDFKTMKFQAANGVDFLDITADATKPCEFTAAGVVDGRASETKVVMGPNGVGAYRTRFVNPDTPGTVGIIFPAQSHSYSDFRGTWSFLQSGVIVGSGLNQYPGQVTFGEERKVNVCDYDTTTWQCVPDTESVLTAAERSDGGVDVNSATGPAVTVYAYRAPNGSLPLFGTTNSAGANTPTTNQTSLVASKLSTLAVPAVGTEVKYWDTSLTIFVATATTSSSTTTTAPAQDANTVIKVDGSAVTRKRISDGREDVVHFNQPLPGLRTRDAGTFNGQNFASIIQVPVPGMGMTLSVNNGLVGPTRAYIMNLSVTRP